VARSIINNGAGNQCRCVFLIADPARRWLKSPIEEMLVFEKGYIVVFEDFCQLFAFAAEIVQPVIVTLECLNQFLIVAELFLELPDARNNIRELPEQLAIGGTTFLFDLVFNPDDVSRTYIKLHDLVKLNFFGSGGQSAASLLISEEAFCFK